MLTCGVLYYIIFYVACFGYPLFTYSYIFSIPIQDIQHDRAGYYICWGCLVWVPSVYTSHSFYLAQHAPPIDTFVGLTIFLFGFLCIFINYDSDHQRYVFRQTSGKCQIVGQGASQNCRPLHHFQWHSRVLPCCWWMDGGD